MNGARELNVDMVLSDGFTHFQGARIAYRSVSGDICEIRARTSGVRSIYIGIFLSFLSFSSCVLSQKLKKKDLVMATRTDCPNWGFLF